MEWYKNQPRNEIIVKMLEEGESISYIAKSLQCNKSTISYYAKKVGLKHSDKVKERIKKASFAHNNNGKMHGHKKSLIIQSIKKNWELKRKKVIEEAQAEWPKIKNSPRDMAFLGIYWGEGGKRGNNISVVNNDPGIIKFCHDYIKLIRDKIEVVVRCYPEQDKDECKKFWEILLGREVKIRNKDWLGKKRRCWSEHGICYVRTSHWQFYVKIITWLALWREEITGIAAKIDPSQPIGHSGLYSTIDYGDNDKPRYTNHK